MRRLLVGLTMLSLLSIMPGHAGTATTSVATGHMAGPAASSVNSCNLFWFMDSRFSVGLVVLQADGTVVGPTVFGEAVLLGAACGTRTGQADLDAEWFVPVGKQAQEVRCLGQGVYTYVSKPKTNAASFSAVTTCTWLHPFGQTQFVGRLSGDITPGVAGHALMVINLA